MNKSSKVSVLEVRHIIKKKNSERADRSADQHCQWFINLQLVISNIPVILSRRSDPNRLDWQEIRGYSNSIVNGRA
jgi:hypothetical protein